MSRQRAKYKKLNYPWVCVVCKGAKSEFTPAIVVSRNKHKSPVCDFCVSAIGIECFYEWLPGNRGPGRERDVERWKRRRDKVFDRKQNGQEN